MEVSKLVRRQLRFPFAAIGAFAGGCFTVTWCGITKGTLATEIVLFVVIGAIAGEIAGRPIRWFIRGLMFDQDEPEEFPRSSESQPAK